MHAKSLETANGGCKISARAYAFRAALFLAATFFAIGIYLPFFPVWLKAQGLSDGAISATVALPVLVRALIVGVLAAGADRFGELRIGAMLYAAAATAVFLALSLAEGSLAILLVSSVALIFWHALIPLGDAVALQGVVRHGIDYGRTRLWGSVAFIGGNFAAGAAIAVFSVDAVYGLQLAAFFAGIGAAALLPAVGPAAFVGRGRGVFNLPRDRRLILAIVAASFGTASHGAYYAFGSLYWRSLGFSDLTIAALWALGVVVEVGLFFLAHRFVSWGARRFLIAGTLGALLRWSLFAFVTFAPLVFALQALHALTFAATHLGMMKAIGAVAANGHTARLQGFYQLVAGLVLGAGMLAAGGLYTIAPQAAFALMALLGLIGLGLAWQLPRGLQPQSPAGGGSTSVPT
ncbi:MFS transporter [Afifella pfennigii]|uniref:MFS transporter n=1 Tax=Afifella pfennigii TaxID=209897 RepID=UPI00047B40F1|nr:MFS transporter [Afifella pfennigii]